MEEEAITYDSVAQYNAEHNTETLHPLVSVIDLSKSNAPIRRKINIELYIVILKDVVGVEMIYGKHHYDYKEGSLVFFAPGQFVTVSPLLDHRDPKGYALVFHPDFIRGTTLGQHIHNYTFFGYATNEALHLSERERQIILQCFEKIGYELQHSIDKHSKKLIVSNIELFLDYCTRFYDRQFTTRDHVNHSTLEKFDTLLNDYFLSAKVQKLGLPTVKYCANELNLSPNYFGDLIKKETGKSAQEYIQYKVIDIAKERVLDPTKSVAEIAYALGFKYPQHFTRLFKQQVGETPIEFRTRMN